MPSRRDGRLPRMPRLAPLRGFQRLPQAPTLASTQPQSSDRAGSSTQPHDPSAPPAQPPPSWQGTPYEWQVYSWLRAQSIPFTTRYDTPTGPPLPDAQNQATHPTFVVGDRSPGLVIEVQQETGSAVAAEAQASVVRKATLQSAGYQYVAVRATDLQSRPDETLTAALDGTSLF